jgi:hypothetical protein
MQNKANFGNDKMNITIGMASNYEYLSRSPRPKNKANSNPIQTQFKPKQTQLNPKQSQNKPNFIYPERSKNRSSIPNIRGQISFFCLLFSEFCFNKSMSLLSASQRFAVDKLIRKRRTIRIKKLTVSRLVANLKQRRVIWRFNCFLIWGIGTCFLGDMKNAIL